ncbi:MAG: DNA starvation/stationary phase protection protein [Prevotellaceae bacterium]|jgi:starvation-inducible DNA-binding protein|nr:DNA starvation/stationary phase protection protein [Prevotellaceae bacterium]
MTVVDYTGIKKKDAETVASVLGIFLADLQIFYANLRGFHWNIKGKSFFALHAKFEEQYDYIAEKIDEVAERILMLGETPENNYSYYLKLSSLKEVSGVSCEIEIVNTILDTYKILIDKERVILEIAEERKDEATVSLMSDYIREQEKTVWMFASFLEAQCKQ